MTKFVVTEYGFSKFAVRVRQMARPTAMNLRGARKRSNEAGREPFESRQKRDDTKRCCRHLRAGTLAYRHRQKNRSSNGRGANRLRDFSSPHFQGYPVL
jgi:hypothetical protein